MSKVVYTADWHLADGAILGKHPTMQGDALFSLRQVIDYCMRDGEVVALVAAGDLFDAKMVSPYVQQQAHKQLQRLEIGRKLISFVFIQGQHEFNAVLPRMSVLDSARHINKTCYQPAGNYPTIYGLDWQPREALPAALEAIAKLRPEVLVCHQVWSELLPFGPEGSLADIRGVTDVVTGDYHVHQDIEVTNAEGAHVRVYSPGSFCFQDRSESVDKAFYVSYPGPDGYLEFESVRLRTRPRGFYGLSTEDDLRRLLEIDLPTLTGASGDLPEEVRKPMVVLRYLESIPGAVAAIDVLRETCHVDAEAVVSADRLVHSVDLTDIRRTQPLSLLDDVTTPGPARDLCAALLRAGASFHEAYAASRAAYFESRPQ